MKYKVLILGGGTGGICVLARLAKTFPKETLAIVEPSKEHYYQPLWTLVGAGIVSKEESRRNESDYIPNGTHWIRDSVRSVKPQKNEVELATGQTVKYEFLVVATGLTVDFQKIKGLEGAL